MSGDGDRLEGESVTVTYGAGTARRDIGLSVGVGECLALVGSNGAGKSSLMQAIAGVVPAGGGRVRLGGRDMSRMPSYKRSRAGLALVPENRHLFGEMTVDETLRLAWANTAPGRWTPESAYELFGSLARRRDSLAANLSGGEAQMLAIARALVLNPTIILLDEPSTGLAPAIMNEVADTIAALLREGLGLLLVEQNISAARRIADEVMVMENGTIIQRGGPEILESGEDLRRAYLGL